jgi:hypothetical protein
MRTASGIQYAGDGMANGVALTAAEQANLAAGGVREVIMYNAGTAAILLGDAVALVLSDTTFGAGMSMEQLDVSDAAFGLIVGGAAEAIPTLTRGRIRVAGVQSGVNVATSVAAGAFVSGGAADGRMAEQATQLTTAATLPPAAAFVMVLAASNAATVRWLNPLNY